MKIRKNTLKETEMLTKILEFIRKEINNFLFHPETFNKKKRALCSVIKVIEIHWRILLKIRKNTKRESKL